MHQKLLHYFLVERAYCWDHFFAETKYDALRYIVRGMFSPEYHKNWATLLDEVLRREQEDSTGIGKGVAIPHLILDPAWRSTDHRVCWMRCKKSIDFGSFDGQPVDIILFVAVPPDMRQDVMAKACEVVMDSRFRESFRNAWDVNGLRMFVNEAVSREGPPPPPKVLSGYRKTTNLVVSHRLGIHARPSMAIVDVAQKFQCSIRLIKGGSEPEIADAKSVMEVIILAGVEGTPIEVEAVGPDADEAISALEELFRLRFGWSD